MDEKTREEMERSLKLLWGDGKPRKRGPKPQLDLDKIAAAATRIADAEGLAAVSMQKVAAELGHTTMSLYTYVPSKSLLLEAMQDHILGQPPAHPPSDDWRSGVLQWSTDIWRLFATHRWVSQIQLEHAPMGPNQLSWFDRLVGWMACAGLDADEAMSAALYVVVSLRGMAQVSSGLSQANPDRSQEDVHAEYDRRMAGFIDPQRFPHLHNAASAAGSTVHQSAADPTALPPQVHFGLQRLLDGIEAYAADGRNR